MIIELAEALSELNSRWTPHPGQIPIGQAILVDGVKDVFAQCGRNFGKTELAAYLLWRWAMFNPGSENYLFEPEQKQAKEILWASGRIQNFGPKEWIDGSPNNTEMRIRFDNGSFIKIDGSDNFDSYRGIKPKGLIIYDELKDINPKFLDAFEPNRAAFEPPALWIGTPPDVESHYTQIAEEAKVNPKWRFFHAPTSANPYIGRDWLADKEAYYKRIGDYETWLREYEAIFVKGGKNHLVPQFLKLEVGVQWPKDMNRWELFVVFDPASSSTFGVLFVLFNPYNKRIKVIDEIYEQDTSLMTTKRIWERVKLKVRDIGRPARYVYDEAAAWFRNEMNEHSQGKVWLEPTTKSKSDKESGLALIRDVIDQGLLEYSEACVKFKWELDNYVKDKNGKIPKKDDHLIDCFRYFLDAAGFELKDKPLPKEVDPLTQKRFYRPEEEMGFEDSLEEID